MDAFQEFAKAIRENLSERAGNPLVSTFAIAWVVWNYRVFVVLFLWTASPAEKFAAIDHVLYPGVTWTWSSFTSGDWAVLFWGPLATALLYVFIIPLPSEAAYRWWSYMQRRLADIRTKINSQRILSGHAAAALRRDLATQTRTHYEELAEKENEIENLKKALVEEGHVRANLNQTLESLRKKLTPPDEIVRDLLSRSYMLYYNPLKPEGRKQMRFGANGLIVEGNNHNEATWRISNGFLEFVRADGTLQNRFFCENGTALFVATGEPDVQAKPGQFMIANHT